MESEIKARIDAVRQLAQRQNALDSALADYEAAYQSATKAGWSEDKLRDIGLRAPESSSAVAGRRSAPAEQAPAMASVVQLPAPAAAPQAAPAAAPAPQSGPMAVPSYAGVNSTLTT